MRSKLSMYITWLCVCFFCVCRLSDAFSTPFNWLPFDCQCVVIWSSLYYQHVEINTSVCSRLWLADSIVGVTVQNDHSWSEDKSGWPMVHHGACGQCFHKYKGFRVWDGKRKQLYLHSKWISGKRYLTSSIFSKLVYLFDLFFTFQDCRKFLNLVNGMQGDNRRYSTYIKGIMMYSIGMC